MNSIFEAMKRAYWFARQLCADIWNAYKPVAQPLRDAVFDQLPVQPQQAVAGPPRIVCRAVIYRAPVYKQKSLIDGGAYFLAKRIHAVGVIASRPAEGAARTWTEIVKHPRRLADGVEVHRDDVVEFSESLQ